MQIILSKRVIASLLGQMILIVLSSQTPGQWTWISGSDQIDDYGIYGLQGVPSPTNHPPGLYEACEWTDHSGNFWLYGGVNPNCICDDMWRFDVSSHEWTWMRGTGGVPNQFPVYGIRGVPGSANSPGFRTESASWVDNYGRFWLYGGIGCTAIGGQPYGDLWLYDPAINMWTWMKGDSIPNPSAIYGNKGVEDSIVTPLPTNEIAINWTSDDGNLWLLDNKGCLWRYNMQTNNWTWIKGNNNASYPVSVFGTKGVPDTANTPGATLMDYSKWKDSQGNFWFLFSGMHMQKILWKFEIPINSWIWIDGDTTFLADSLNYFAGQCNFEQEIIPFARKESRSCWIDYCDNLWLMGGYADNHWQYPFTSNDLIYFNPHQSKWYWADNDTAQIIFSNSGQIGISSPTNMPASRSGANGFRDNEGNFWLFGGSDSYFIGVFSDLWIYSPDTSCSKCMNLASVENQGSADNSILLFPNPGNQNIHLKSETEFTRVELFDSTGRKIQDNIVYATDYDFGGMQTGIYFVKVFFNENVVVKKIVFQ